MSGTNGKINVVTTVAGTGDNACITNNVAATSSDLMIPNSVAVDASGNLYIGTAGNIIKGYANEGLRTLDCYIQKVSKGSGIITAIAGKGYCGSYGDGGPATMARINPYGLALGEGKPH